MKALCSLIIIIGWLFHAKAAQAVSNGNVTGVLQFYNNQKSYCASGNNCTGAKFPQTQANTNRPIRDVNLYVKRASDNVLLGSGTTNSSGVFNMSWYDATSFGNVPAILYWRGEHKDGRFRLATTAGGFWVFSASITLLDNTVMNAGSLTWGTSSSPNAYANMYDAAYMTWSQALAQSLRMVLYFNNVQIRAFEPAGPAADCPTSCALGPANAVLINDEATGSPAYDSQGRVMHEIGHLASYLSSRDQSFSFGDASVYLYDTGPGWDYHTIEWGSAAFEEGFATLVATIALYHPHAPAPRVCGGGGVPCTGLASDVESSFGSSCGNGGKRRKPMHVVRYLWDVYDSVNDGIWNDSVTLGFGTITDGVNASANGHNNRQKNEPWNTGFTAVIDPDGRSAVDYRENLKGLGTDTTLQLANNCGGSGD